MGTYGRSFTLQSSSQNDVGSPMVGPGNPGQYTEEAGMLGYNEVRHIIEGDDEIKMWHYFIKARILMLGNHHEI